VMSRLTLSDACAILAGHDQGGEAAHGIGA